LGPDQRWTGRLQGILGDGFEIIEEGLSGRTSDVDYDDRPGCNGRTYFVPCLQTHHPLDAVVVMRGTNDLKTCFDRAADQIADALRGYLDDIPFHATDRRGQTPAIVLVSPILIDAAAPLYEEMTATASTAQASRGHASSARPWLASPQNEGRRTPTLPPSRAPATTVST
jgi:lysophospholipase L1-like esterase